MAIQSSFPKVADQIISFNKNIVDILSKLNSINTTTDPVISFDILDENGVLKKFSIPSYASLRSDIERLNNNINSLYSIDAAGSIIQTSLTGQNKFKKIITVDLNREPQTLGAITQISKFKTSPNWFFDSMLDPMLSVEFDLSRVENNVRKCQSRRYIVEFAKNNDGSYTTLGQSALESFNNSFIGKAQITLQSFLNWHQTTPGVVEPLNPKYDEQIFDLEPNSLQYDGIFTVVSTSEDKINRKLWYLLDTINYREINTSQQMTLALGDELLVNTNNDKSSTRYKVIEIDTNSFLPNYGVRLERIEGIEPIPAMRGALKLYSPVIYSKKVKVSIGYDERNVVFLKPVNAENNLVSRDWSSGTAFYTAELLLEDSSSANGLSLRQFYTDYVYDYGQVLKDFVAKKIPNNLAGTPNIPTLNTDNFKVVQVNQHLTDTPDANLLKQKHNIHLNLKSEIEQLQNAISDKNKKIKITPFKSISDKKKFDLEVVDLENKKESRSKQLASLSQEIINLSKLPSSKVDPKFRLRGFWSMPEAVATKDTKPQEVVQFRIQYKYLSKDGKETPIETFQIDGQQSKASFSNWQSILTDSRKRGYDQSTGEYFWQIEDTTSADTPNINQLDLPIQSGERIQIRVQSISEVGWPDSPITSDWSEIITVDFPDDLNNVLNETDFILKEATKEDLKVSMKNELTAQGFDQHISDQMIVDGKTYHHETSSILSGFKDSNGLSLDLYDYLQSLQERIKSLEDKINRAKGELEVIIFRNNQEFVISNGSETIFNIECEDYLESYTAQGVPTGRVYQNNIYVIKDFVIRVRNKSTSPLGLLSNRTYLQNSSIYNSSIPQCFWVNDKDELLTSDITASTKTQINNQFIWSVNYDSVSDTTVTKLSENIGNSFTTNNSITGVLSSNEYNIGYNETSIINFVGNNRSLLEPIKWVDNTVSVASTTKLLTSIHPVAADLEKITETNSEKVKTLNSSEQNDVVIPINIYFKMNSLDTNQSGLNYNYINLNSVTKTVKHVKKLRIFLENEAENRPFVFSIKFNINRNKTIMKKTVQAINTQIK